MGVRNMINLLLFIIFCSNVGAQIPVGTCYAGNSILFSPVIGDVEVTTIFQKVSPDRILFTAQPTFNAVVFCLKTMMVESQINQNISSVIMFTDICDAAIPAGVGFESLLPFCTEEGRYNVFFNDDFITFADDSLFADNCTTRSSLLRGNTFVRTNCSATCNCLEPVTLPPTPAPTPAAVTIPAPPPSIVTAAECTPTSGGLVRLRGNNLHVLNDRPFLNIAISGVPCTFGGVVASTFAYCQFVPGVGAGYPLSIDNNISITNGITFSYCPPTIRQVDVVQLSNTTYSLTLTGTNYGWLGSQIDLKLSRPGDFSPLSCTGVYVIDFHYKFNCTVTEPKDGQYFLSLSVGGVQSLDHPSVEFSGTCYGRQVPADDVVRMLIHTSLTKSIIRMRGLLDGLKQIKQQLQPYDGDNCDGTTPSYPLPTFELQLLNSDSFGFKDCIDQYCSAREQYLSSL